MRITVDQASLLRELSLLQGIIERKATLPILSNVLLVAEADGRLRITATDLEIGFRSSLPATVEQAGGTTVHARRLHDIIRRLPAGHISFKHDDGSLHLQCERIRYRLATQEASLFPSLREKDGTPVAQIDAAPLADMLKRVLFAITSDDPRYSIGGALFAFGDDKLTMVGTDGHRLALSRRAVHRSETEAVTMVVPRKAASELLRLAGDHEGDVFLWNSDGGLFAQMGEREISTSLQEQKFPDYQRVLPENNDKTLQIETTRLKSAIERVAVLSQEHTHLIKFELEEGLLRLSSAHQQLGEAQEELGVEYLGDSLAIGFNAQYLLDFLAVVGTEKVVLSLGKVMGQGLFSPLRAEDDEREDSYVVMPMALS